jgi:hypothetical protein
VVTGGPDAAGEVRFADLHRFVFQRGRHRGVPEVDEAGRRDGGYDLDDVLFVPMPVQLGEPCVGDGVGGLRPQPPPFRPGYLTAPCRTTKARTRDCLLWIRQALNEKPAPRNLKGCFSKKCYLKNLRYS